MIKTEAQLQQAIEQIERLYRGLDSLRAGVLRKNPRTFAILAEGPLDQIVQLHAEITRYIARIRALELSNTAKGEVGPRTWKRDDLYNRRNHLTG
jgi:hypothetical protein